MGEWPALKAEVLGLDFLASLIRDATDGLVVLDEERRCMYANAAAGRLLGCPSEQLLGRDLAAILPASERPAMLECLKASVAGRPAASSLVLPLTDGSGRDVEARMRKHRIYDKHVAVCVLRDVSPHRRQVGESAVVAEAAGAAALNESIEATIQALAECAVRGTRALGAAVVLDDEDACAAWIQVAGLPDEYRHGIRAACEAGGTLDGFEMQELMAHRVVVSPDARSKLERDPRTALAIEPLKSLPWQGSAYAPVVSEGAIHGVLHAIFREDDLPSKPEVDFLAMLADQAAVAASNARKIAAAQERVAHEERRRLSRELHDFVSPALYGIALGARVARELLDRDPSQAAQPLDIVLRLAEEGLQETRALIFERRPESLEMEGLVASLNRQLGTLRSRHGIAADDVRGAEPDASTEAKLALYRIGQEALQNAVKHADAKRVDVRLVCEGASVRLDIEDDGVGFDPKGEFPGHLGLRSMRERALAAGGWLEVESPRVEGTGTRVIVSVPADAQSGEAGSAGRPRLGAAIGSGAVQRP